MGRPKKWYLAEQSGVTSRIFLFNYDDSRMKLPDSDELFGRVLDIAHPKKGKYPSEGVIVSFLWALLSQYYNIGSYIRSQHIFGSV